MSDLEKNDGVDAGKLAFMTFVGTILVVVLVFVVQGLYYRWEREETVRKNFGHKPMLRRTYEAEQAKKLGSYRWVDKSAEKVALPIERAMNLVTQEALEKRNTVKTEAVPASLEVVKPMPRKAPPKRQPKHSGTEG